MLIRFTPNSLVGQSYQPRSKLNPLTLYEGLSLGLGALGGFLGSSNTSSTNKTNLRIARENNAFNERMFDRQIAYNWEMFNAENEYNSPQAQVQRYIDAGINPALAMEGQSAATAQGGSASQAASAGNPTMVPYDPSASLGRVSDVLYAHAMREKELSLLDENIEKQDLENRFNADYYKTQLRRANYDAMRAYTQGLITQQDYIEQKRTYEDRMASVSQDLRLKRGQADYQQTIIQAQNLENKLKQWHLEKAPEEFKAQMAVLGAQVQAYLAQRDSSLAAAKKFYQEGLESAARTYGIELDNQKADALFESSVLAGLSENYLKAASSANERQHELDKKSFLYGDSPGQRFLRRGAQVSDYLAAPIKGLLRIGK